MLEEITEEDSRKEEEINKAKLNKPFATRFELLVYLKQRKDLGLATKASAIVNKFYRDIRTGFSYLKTLEQIHIIKNKKNNEIVITKKGEQFIFRTILPIFSNQQKITRKIFFRENLTHGDLVLQDKIVCLENAFGDLLPNSLEWFKRWLSTEFGKHILFDEWFLEFEKQHEKFFQEQLTIEKKKLIGPKGK